MSKPCGRRAGDVRAVCAAAADGGGAAAAGVGGAASRVPGHLPPAGRWRAANAGSHTPARRTDSHGRWHLTNSRARYGTEKYVQVRSLVVNTWHAEL